MRLGELGKSKDYRPDLKQMAVGVVIDGAGWPIFHKHKVRLDSQTYYLLTELKGSCVDILRTACVRILPTVRQILAA